jgi:hypothetical protein
MEARIFLKRDCLAWTGGGVSEEILRQTPRDQRSSATIAMLHAAQELLLTSFWKKEPPPKLIWKTTIAEWRFETVSYIYLSKPDDRVFRICATARKREKELVLLIPPRYEHLVREALKPHRRRDYFSLFTVDGYLAWRTMFAGTDAHWPRRKVILWWLSRYNRFVRSHSLPKTLLVQLEPVASAPASWPP